MAEDYRLSQALFGPSQRPFRFAAGTPHHEGCLAALTRAFPSDERAEWAARLWPTVLAHVASAHNDTGRFDPSCPRWAARTGLALSDSWRLAAALERAGILVERGGALFVARWRAEHRCSEVLAHLCRD